MLNRGATSLPFRIKICGVTSLSDASFAMASGADAIGLNFYPKSKRFISSSTAQQICEGVGSHGSRVAVVVDASLNEIAAIRSSVDIDWVQLHGDEPPELIAELKRDIGVSVIRAFRWQSEHSDRVSSYLNRCAVLGCLPDAILIDAYSPREHGGTGAVADWASLVRWRKDSAFKELPLILAGGLTPTIVAQAISQVQPDAVDTASGVEASPGIKSPELVGQFVATAKRAFGN